MRVRYSGASFYGSEGLTNGRVYVCLGVEDAGDFGAMLRIVDNSGEDYLYSPRYPAPLDGSSGGGKWEVVEDDEKGTLASVIR